MYAHIRHTHGVRIYTHIYTHTHMYTRASTQHAHTLQTLASCTYIQLAVQDIYLLLIDNGDNLSLDVLAEHRARHQTSFLQHTHKTRKDPNHRTGSEYLQVLTFISPISVSSLHAEA